MALPRSIWLMPCSKQYPSIKWVLLGHFLIYLTNLVWQNGNIFTSNTYVRQDKTTFNDSQEKRYFLEEITVIYNLISRFCPSLEQNEGREIFSCFADTLRFLKKLVQNIKVYSFKMDPIQRFIVGIKTVAMTLFSFILHKNLS